MLHIAIFVIAWIGVLPSERPTIASTPAIEVEIVSDITPKKPKEAAKPKPKPAPPPPPPPRRAAPPPPPEPKVVKAPDPVAVPEPKIDPPKKKPIPKPKAVEKPKPKPEPPKKVQKPAPRPKSKPKPPPKHDFASVLKTVDKLEKNAPPPKKPEKKKPEAKKKKDVAPLQQVAELLKKKPTQSRLQRAQSGLTSNELDAIRQHIEPCWNLPAGARDAGSMVVEIRATLNPDGQVRTAVIVNDARARSDGFYRSMAESALRAMLNPRCQPLPLPLDKYSEWRDMVIFFDPQEMF